MTISIATMGKYWMLPDGGGLVCPGGGEGSYSSFLEGKRKPVVLVDRVIQEENNNEICVEVTGVYYD